MPRFLTDYALRFAAQTRRIMSSNGFFYGVVLIFVVEASWIALTAVYPQAFDEQYHLGIIKVYAHQWSPFFAHQPAGANIYGAVVRDPSYMYHYLLSFPYRLIAHYTHRLPILVISLRLISVAVLTIGLFVFRRLLRSVPLSRALTHLILLFFILTPVVPLLAAQINYDNAFITMTGLCLLWTLQLLRSIREEHRLPLVLGLQLLAACLFTSLIKYAFLPIFALIVILVAYNLYRLIKNQKNVCKNAWQSSQRWRLAMISIATAVLLFLFVAMYGVNIVRYHTPIPDCKVVIGQKACLNYSAWARNYQDPMLYPRPTLRQIVVYPAIWANQSMRELTFAIAGNFESDGVTVDYYAADPLPIMHIFAWFVAGVGLILSLRYGRRLRANPSLRALAIISAVYVLVLFFQNFGDFLKTHQPVAIHGRYLLPVLPLVYAFIAYSAVWAIKRQKESIRQKLYAGQLWLVVLGIILMVQGSGFITYIVRSDPDWLWPQNNNIHKVNHAAKKVLHKVVVGSP